MYYNFGSKLHSFFSQIKMEMHEVIVYILYSFCVYMYRGNNIYQHLGKKVKI